MLHLRADLDDRRAYNVLFLCTGNSAMSQLGQTEKNSVRANVFRVAPESGHCSMQSACLKGANTGSEDVLHPRMPRLGHEWLLR